MSEWGQGQQVSSSWSGCNSLFFLFVLPFVKPKISPLHSFYPLRSMGQKPNLCPSGERGERPVLSSTWARFSYFKIFIWCSFYSRPKFSWKKKFEKRSISVLRILSVLLPSVPQLFSYLRHWFSLIKGHRLGGCLQCVLGSAAQKTAVLLPYTHLVKGHNGSVQARSLFSLVLAHPEHQPLWTEFLQEETQLSPRAIVIAS